MTQKIRVLIVDDSKLIRDVLTAILNEQPDIEVVGAAADAFQARDLIKQLNPDVITLDVEMPKMNGLEFLDKLMRAKPTPVVMISTATERGSEVTFRALELGAVDFVTKPKLAEQTPDDYGDIIAEKVRAAKTARLKGPAPRRRLLLGGSHDAARDEAPGAQGREDGRSPHRGRRVHGRHRRRSANSWSACRRTARAS
jgi:two-component system chemotaxis response regulator CheB